MTIEFKNQIFIRFGKFGKNSKSKVGLDSEFRNDVLSGKKFESGLSVYFAKPNKNGWILVEPDKKRAAYGLTHNYIGDMIERIFLPSIAKGEIYLVKGDLIEIEAVGYDDASESYFSTGTTTYEVGSDGEPVIENAKIIKRLKPNEVYINSWGEKTLEDIYGKMIDQSYFDQYESILETGVISNDELENIFIKDDGLLIDLIHKSIQILGRNQLILTLETLSDLWDKNKKINPISFIETIHKSFKKTKNFELSLQMTNKYFIKETFIRKLIRELILIN